LIRNTPYDYEYQWSRIQGLPIDHVDYMTNQVGLVSPVVSRMTGNVGFCFDSWVPDDSSAACERAVGIYFLPPTPNGVLSVSSPISYHSRWYSGGCFGGWQGGAWVGLAVDRYLVSNSHFDGALIRQYNPIIDQDIHWWFGTTGPWDDNNAGYPLNAQFRVDNSHWYAVWVWCGGHLRSAGEHWAVGLVEFLMRVPSIELSYDTLGSI
jgi:hypothetical protein